MASTSSAFNVTWHIDSSMTSTNSCAPCEYLMLSGSIWAGGWRPDTELPILREIQEIVDPFHNTTSTSISCISTALAAYQGTNSGPMFNTCAFVTLNDDCELVCYHDGKGDLGDGFLGSITLSGGSGDFAFFSGRVAARVGSVSTTDNDGSSTCIDWSTSIPSIATYNGRITSHDGKPGGIAVRYWEMPDLTSLFPGEAAFEQCKFVMQAPPPVALTAANEIVLTQRTLTSRRTAVSQTNAVPVSSLSKPALPGSGSSSATPKRTSKVTSTLADLRSSSGDSEGTSTMYPPSETSRTTLRHEGDPDVSNTESGRSLSLSPQIGSGSGQVEDPATPPSRTSADSASQNADPSNENATSSSGSSTSGNGVSGQPEDTTATLSTATSTNSLGDDATEAASKSCLRITTTSDDDFVRHFTPTTQGYRLTGPTITEGGEVAVISGTSYSALPSHLGLVAISDTGTTTLPVPELSNHGIRTVASSQNVYVLPEQTLEAGDSAIIVSGATYSAVPQGSGIEVAVNDETSRVAITKPKIVPGIGEVGLIDDSSDDYVLDGSVTMFEGGAAATTSNTVYLALPSGFGVLAVSDAGSDDFASYIAEGIAGTELDQSGSNGYIIGFDSSAALKASVITVSGVAYSAMPSGSGVLMVADGETRTIELAHTVSDGPGVVGGNTATTLTDSGHSNISQSAAVYTGASPSRTWQPAWIWLVAFFAILAM